MSFRRGEPADSQEAMAKCSQSRGNCVQPASRRARRLVYTADDSTFRYRQLHPGL